ncbi:hypothetical protein HII31_10337 [Pseudocercospora fuligena]|uniref:Uncharacterized protein n=1 Tax=Pseudocercospora fuligena TaxID=685502 RepID=A0A8H6RC19_9PEZI|nr:hypothetical protein HII31_10337 [Pseudocercospora fuligena]
MPPTYTHLLSCAAGAILGAITVYTYTRTRDTDPPTSDPLAPSPPTSTPPTITPSAKIPVTNHQAWKRVFGARLLAAWAAAIVIDDNVSADLLATIGRQEFGEERWAIEVHRFRDELM